MEPNDDSDAVIVIKDSFDGANLETYEGKKADYWLGGVLSCMSTITSFFGRADYLPSKSEYILCPSFAAPPSSRDPEFYKDTAAHYRIIIDCRYYYLH